MQDAILCPGEGLNLQVFWGAGEWNIYGSVIEGQANGDVVLNSSPPAGTTTINFLNQHDSCGIYLWYAICCTLPPSPPTPAPITASTTLAATTTSTASVSVTTTNAASGTTTWSASIAATTGTPSQQHKFHWPWWATMVIVVVAVGFFIGGGLLWRWSTSNANAYEEISS